VNLRRLCLAASLVAAVVSILATIEDWSRPGAWLAAAVGFIALAGVTE
jgi:uncharacterized membrane protein HdeD (DUF308 family)